jgi:phasin family protein
MAEPDFHPQSALPGSGNVALHKKPVYPMYYEHSDPTEATTMTDYVTQWIDLSKAAMEPLMKLNELNMKAVDQLAQQQVDLMKDYMDLGTRSFKKLSESKDVQEFWAAQAELVKEYGDKFISRARTYSDLAAETQAKLAEWQERALKEVAKRMEQEAVQKKAA